VIARVRAGAVVVLAVGLLSACANVNGVAPASSPTKQTTAAPLTTPVSPGGASSAARAGGCSAGAAFALSLPLGISGAPTPVQAAERFVVHGGVPGYGNSSSRWQISAHDAQGVTLTAGSVRLHALQLHDKTWVVDSGERCAS
jgi:hypothetical protein